MNIQRPLAAMTALVFIASCGSSARTTKQPNKRPSRPLPSFPPIVDAPFELAHEMDRAQVAAQYGAMALTDPKRAVLRTRLADEYGRRLKLALAAKQPLLAYEHLSSLARLWHPSELTGATVAGIDRYAQHASLVRAELARAGDDKRALTVLVMLLAADPANAAKHRKEIAEVLAYGDGLMVSLAGKPARRARPIAALQHAADRWPTPFVVDTLIKLFTERQQVFAKHFKRHGADFQMMRAHGMGVMHTAWHIVRLYARAGRVGEALPTLDKVVGLGGDPDLVGRLQKATRSDARARDWLRLARRFKGITDKRQKDWRAVAQLLATAAKRFPSSYAISMAAGDTAQQLEEPLLAMRHYKAAYKASKQRMAAMKLAGLYNYQINSLLFGSRPQAAKVSLAEFETFYAAAAKRWPKKKLPTDLATIYATMGRGYAGLGELDKALSYLKRSVKQRPTLTAYEMIIRISLKRNDHSAAIAAMSGALKLPASSGRDKLKRAEILALGAEANNALNNKTTALQYAFGAIDTWSKLLENYDLKFSAKAQIFIDWGKVAWTVGRKKQAIQLFETVVDGAAKRHIDARILSSMVSFLVVRGHYDLAVDAYYRLLGSRKADPETKVYMSLWIMAEALRTKRTVDPLATAYLSGRKGSLWYDDLARLATGRTTFAALSARATTRARRAELLYYAASLETSAANSHRIETMMRGVLDTQVVLFFEYDMANLWLNRRIGRASTKH